MAITSIAHFSANLLKSMEAIKIHINTLREADTNLTIGSLYVPYRLDPLTQHLVHYSWLAGHNNLTQRLVADLDKLTRKMLQF